MSFLGDFHIHSTFSDGKLTIPELVDLYGLNGFGVIAITDHLCEDESIIGKAAKILDRTLTRSSFPLYRAILESEAKRAWDQYGMLLIPGFELTQNHVSNRRSAHILALGVNEFLAAHHDAKILARTIRAQGGLAVAAHPVWTHKNERQTFHLWDRRAELGQEFDAWEVASGQHLFEEVRASGLPVLASSDLHRREQFPSWKTQFNCSKDIGSVLNAIRKQEIELVYYNEQTEEPVA
jgi:predicted metal-dependent phosphoesterase TrpH